MVKTEGKGDLSMKKNLIVGVACLSVIVIAVVSLIFCSSDCMGNLFSGISDNTPTNSFGYVKGKLAIVAFSKGQGSGFIIQQSEKKYLVTNEHVIRSGNGEDPRVMMLNGNVLKLGNCEISRDRDLMRFEIETDAKALSLADRIPEIGDNVTIYGNSDGGGVSTEIQGKVLGVGGDRIEVSSSFVNGNSGSPVIDSHGMVVGVATYLTNYTNANDWVKKDTRFNGVRRYATRLVDMPWFPIAWAEYRRQIREFNDFEFFLKCLSPYLVAHYSDVADDVLSYSEVNRMEYNSLSNGLHNAMIAVRNSYRKLAQDSAEWQRASKGKDSLMDYIKGKGSDEKTAIMKEYDAIALDKFATVVERLFDFNQCLRDALGTGQKMLQESRITIPLLKNGVDEDTGVDRYYKVLDLFQVDLRERLSSCSNVMEYASKLLDGKQMRDKEFGWVLLNHIAHNGNIFAQKKIIELYENQFDRDFLNGYIHDERVQGWIEAGFKAGKKKLGLFLGELAYQRMQYKDAEMYWVDAAESGVIDAWVRLGKFHSYKQEHGGGPEGMQKIEIAREAFGRAYKSGELSSAQREGATCYGKICLMHPQTKDDVRSAIDIFGALMNADPHNATNYWWKGVAIYVREHGRCNGGWKWYVKKAAELGHKSAKRSLDSYGILDRYYQDAMKSMKLEIGGVGVIFLDDVDFPFKSRMRLCKTQDGYEWCYSHGFAYNGYVGISEIGNANEMVDVRNYSWEDAASLLRGDVGSEIFIRACRCDNYSKWSHGEAILFRLKRVPIATDKAGVY